MSITSEAQPGGAARIQLISNPIASPGKCGICGKFEHEKGFADARLDFEFFGTLYFCADCAGEFARLFGFISPEQATQLAQYISELTQENEILKASLENLESAVEHLTNYRMLRNTIGDVDNSVTVSGSTDETPALIDETVGGTVVEFPGGVTETESELNEPVSEQRPDDIPSPTSDNSSIGIIDL